MPNSPLNILTTLKKAFDLLKRNDPLILSASTAFFTTFSISPILIILLDFLGLFFDPEDIHKEIFDTMSITLGEGTAKDIHTIVHGFKEQQTSAWVTIATTLFFYFIATTLLGVIKQSIHRLWKIRKKAEKNIMYNMKERMIGVGLLFVVAVLVVHSYFIDRRLLAGLEDGSVLTRSIDSGFSFLIVVIWFTLVLKLLPEARMSWKVGLTGGLFTGVLFKGGELLLGKILIHWKLVAIFGVSSSMAVILLFIFYCSFILYLGAAFTCEYAKAIRKPIQPGKYAIEYVEEITAEGR